MIRTKLICQNPESISGCIRLSGPFLAANRSRLQLLRLPEGGKRWSTGLVKKQGFSKNGFGRALVEPLNEPSSGMPDHDPSDIAERGSLNASCRHLVHQKALRVLAAHSALIVLFNDRFGVAEKAAISIRSELADIPSGNQTFQRCSLWSTLITTVASPGW